MTVYEYLQGKVNDARDSLFYGESAPENLRAAVLSLADAVEEIGRMMLESERQAVAKIEKMLEDNHKRVEARILDMDCKGGKDQ